MTNYLDDEPAVYPLNDEEAQRRKMLDAQNALALSDPRSGGPILQGAPDMQPLGASSPWNKQIGGPPVQDTASPESSAAMAGKPLPAITPVEKARGQAAAMNQKVADLAGQEPVYKPKLWQKIVGIGGAAALGGLGGYINAGGKTRPIDTSGVAEGVKSLIAPGFRQQQAQYGRDVKSATANAAAKQAELEGLEKAQKSDSDLATATATQRHLISQANALDNAPTKPTNEWAELKDLVVDPAHPEIGPQAAFFNKNDPKSGLVYGRAPAAATPKNEPTSYHVLNDGKVIAIHTDDAGKSKSEVVYAGDPKVETDLTDLQIGGKPHKVIVNKQTGLVIKDLGESGIKPPVVNVDANNRKDRTAGLKAFTPALESGERFNVMAKNYEDAIKNHDQQAMLSLLANHLGMTMGLQKGSRLTKDIIHEAENSRPWLQGLAAKFDKNGYLSGVNLTPEQMRQMVNLGRERFAEDIAKGRSEAKYMGLDDDGPTRTPSRATINHYTALANGDVAKAKQLAAADGWSIQVPGEAPGGGGSAVDDLVNKYK